MMMMHISARTVRYRTMGEYLARGEDYIFTTEQNIAEQNNMCPSRVKGHYIAFPTTGDVYDFCDAIQPVWVCGKSYSTVGNGGSSSIDVQGKKIEVTKVRKGDVTEFAQICFIVKREA